MTDTLDDIAGRINALFTVVDAATKDAAEYRAKAEGHRVAAAKLLLSAYHRIKAPGSNVAWGQWCKENIRRSEADIRRLLVIARADDPDAAHEDAKKKTREQVKRTRADHTAAGMSGDDPAPVTAGSSIGVIEAGPEDITEYDIWKKLTRFQKGMFLDYVARTSPKLYAEHAPATFSAPTKPPPAAGKETLRLPKPEALTTDDLLGAGPDPDAQESPNRSLSSPRLNHPSLRPATRLERSMTTAPHSITNAGMAGAPAMEPVPSSRRPGLIWPLISPPAPRNARSIAKGQRWRYEPEAECGIFAT
jgi:hypothetical protein